MISIKGVRYMADVMDAYREVPAIAIEIGYEMKTTFWGDFTVAERVSGIAGVKDTFKRAFKEWKDNEVYLTEMYMIANWKVWQHYQTNEALARAYQEIDDTIDEYVDKHYSKEQKDYFYSTTD